MSATEFKPQEITQLMRLVRPAVQAQWDRRQEARARRGDSGRGGGARQLEEVLFALARLDLLDPHTVRDLLADAPAPEEIIAKAERGLQLAFGNEVTELPGPTASDNQKDVHNS